MAATTWLDLVIKRALFLIGVSRAGETLDADDADTALAIVNEILDDWNAERVTVYHDVISTFPLTPNLQPHTIGPTGTFIVTQRPVSIEAMNVVQGAGATRVRYPVTPRDRTWWIAKATPGTTSALPTDFWYDPDSPNGAIWLWGVPTTAYTLELLVRMVLASVQLTDTVALPPGYLKAITYTLAEEAGPAFGQPVPASVVLKASRARARVQANNRITPRLLTRDRGVPTQRPHKTFNYLNRSL